MSTFLGVASSQGTMLTLTGRPGDFCTRTDVNGTFELTGTDPTNAANWYQIKTGVRTTTAASSATPSPSADTDDVYTVTALAVAAAVAAPTGSPVNGQAITVRIKDNGSPQTLSWASGWRAIGTTLPTVTVAGQTLYVRAWYNSADSKWDVLTAVSG